MFSSTFIFLHNLKEEFQNDIISNFWFPLMICVYIILEILN